MDMGREDAGPLFFNTHSEKVRVNRAVKANAIHWKTWSRLPDVIKNSLSGVEVANSKAFPACVIEMAAASPSPFENEKSRYIALCMYFCNLDSPRLFMLPPYTPSFSLSNALLLRNDWKSSNTRPSTRATPAAVPTQRNTWD